MVYLTQLVYLREGQDAILQEVEDIVLPLLSKYQGELLLRLRPDRRIKISGSGEVPYELHVVRFKSEDDLARYSNDDERKRVLHLKDKAVASTLLIKGALV